MGESTQILLHLIATVFWLYGLLPKDYPGVRDTSVRMSLCGIMGTAWRDLRFTREGLHHVIFFFAVIGIMLFSAFVAVSALLSILIGHAHAQDCNGGSCFTLPPGNQDIAQAWIDYLFLNTPLPSYYDQMGNAIPTTLGIQTALTQVLAFYSDAILIIAAMILFYHLTAMVAETAHHGQVMGKRANQVWAPIRLVVAIGLLIPINAGLNSGQYIVIKMAEVGSALATNGWATFLSAIANYKPNPVAPMAPVVSQTAADMMSIDACVYDYNARVGVSFPNGGGPTIPPGGITNSNAIISGHPGTKVSFSPPNAADQDMCGWYFIPNPPTATDTVTAEAFGEEQTIFQQDVLGSTLLTAATTGPTGIIQVMPYNIGGNYGSPSQTPITLDDPSSIDAVVQYQVDLGNAMVAVGSSANGAVQQAIQTLQSDGYGWVAAGALLNTVVRIQAMVSDAATAGTPETHPPGIFDPNANGGAGIIEKAFWPNSAAPTASGAGDDIRQQVAEDLTNYHVLTSKTWAQANASTGANAQCAAMIGLQDSAQHDGHRAGNWLMNQIFTIVDEQAVHSGVWTSGTGEPCSPNSPEAGLNTFKVGIQQITGGDPLAELSALGHANLDTAFELLGISLAATGAGDIVEGLSDHFKTNGLFARFGKAVSKVSGAVATILSFIAMIFLICGFTLAYILPMFPYARFFFATLVWVAAMLEAVVAVPLIALAHLNPEGEGLPGASARNAYFYVFNILLRPILMIFGLVCGLLLFFIAISFLTYTFNLAVAASGGTAYGHEMLSKLIYTIMYVVMMYVCANHCFSLIDHIPEKALSWMGAQAQAMAHVGDESKIASTEMMGGSIVTQQLFQTLGSSANQAGDGLKALLGKTPISPAGGAGAAGGGTVGPARPPPGPPPGTRPPSTGRSS